MRRYKTSEVWGWLLFNTLIVTAIVLPLGDVLLSVFHDSEGVWSHLAETVLPRYIRNTLILALGVVTATIVIGVSTAWIVTHCEFPGRKLVQWALILPLAIPSYLLAYATTDFFQYAGPFQTMLRETFQWEREDYWFPTMRSLPGAICILSVSLYPYVYLACRTAFLQLDRSMLQTSRLLGAGPFRTFRKVTFPLVRPAVIAGAMLVLMETLAEFGAVDYCAVDTFATGIYRTWLSHGSLVGAGQLSACLVGAIITIIICHRWLGRNKRVSSNNGGFNEVQRIQPGFAGKMLSSIIVWTPVVLGFLLPLSIFIDMTIENGDQRAMELLGELAQNSILVSAIVAMACVVLSFGLLASMRRCPHFINQTIVSGSGLGYAIPGTVIAIGCLSPLYFIEEQSAGWCQAIFSYDPGFWATSTIAGLAFGYICRFLAVSNGMVRAGYQRIPETLDDASFMLRRGSLRTISGVHLPLLSSSLFMAGLMVFVDAMKELPITLVLRPFNFDTLAVRVYQLASDERLDEAAASALAIIVVGLVPVVILSKYVFSKNMNSSPE